MRPTLAYGDSVAEKSSTSWDNGRWIGELTEKQMKAVLSSDDVEVIEWPIGGFTFHGSAKLLGIVRSGAMGGDTRVIHGAWRYHSLITYALDMAEIRGLPAGVRVRGEGLLKP